jgi:hypothetical protein
MQRPARYDVGDAELLLLASPTKEGRSKVVGIIGLLVVIILIILLLRLL